MLINRKDVIRIKMPFPDISSVLAVNSHMYICCFNKENQVGFVKCQTLKPYMITDSPMKHYWDEEPDIQRNPFMHTTRIDCDKEFVTRDVQFDDRLKTTTRTDVCEDTMKHVEGELECDGYMTNNVQADDLLEINGLVTVR